MPVVSKALYDARETDLMGREDRICYSRQTKPGDCDRCPAKELCLWVSRHEPSED